MALLDMDDPQKRMLLMMGLGLMGGAPGQRKNFGADLAHAGLMGMQGYDSGRAFQVRKAEEDQQREMRQMQMAEMQRQSQERTAMQDAARRNFAPGMSQMQPSDYETPSGPAGPGSMNWAGYVRDLAPINPDAAFARAAQLSQMNQRNLHTLGENQVLMDSGGNVVGRGMPKNDGPKKGATRDIISGDRTLQYEWTGEKWQKIGEGPRFKAESPEKPPQGYRATPDGGLTFIPGGPADPNRPGAKTPEHPTEDERRSAGLTVRLAAALKTIEENPKAQKPEILPSVARAMPGQFETIPNVMTSTERQKVESAQLDALDAALTLATGAAYTKDQLQNLRKSYFPQIGDSDATVKEKEDRFKKIIETARIRAGRAAHTIEPVLNNKPSGGDGWSMKPIS